MVISRHLLVAISPPGDTDTRRDYSAQKKCILKSNKNKKNKTNVGKYVKK